MEFNIIKQLFMTRGFCTCEEISGWAPIGWIGGYSFLEKKKKETISSVDMRFLYLAVLHAESEEQLLSVDLSISVSVGMPQVKML